MALRVGLAFKNYLFEALGSRPAVCGKMIYENLTRSGGDYSYTGIHGTRLHRVQKQLENGSLHKTEQDVYIYPNWPWNHSRAAYWAGNADDAIILELGSNERPIPNRVYNTICFPRESDVTVLRAWKVSDLFKERAWRNAPKE